jgi:hypothetical protein
MAAASGLTHRHACVPRFPDLRPNSRANRGPVSRFPAESGNGESRAGPIQVSRPNRERAVGISRPFPGQIGTQGDRDSGISASVRDYRCRLRWLFRARRWRGSSGAQSPRDRETGPPPMVHGPCVLAPRSGRSGSVLRCPTVAAATPSLPAAFKLKLKFKFNAVAV